MTEQFKTRILISGQGGRYLGKKIPSFYPEEIIRDFWMYRGAIYIEKPQGGPILKPRAIRPIQAEMLDESEFGRLWRLTFWWRRHRNWMRPNQIIVLNVWNATKEKDGSRQQFTLLVPLNMRTAHQAVAWTFGTTIERYRPEKET